jgi:glucan endo-1,3-alpha-glucosidase
MTLCIQWNGGWPTKLTSASVQSLTSAISSGSVSSALDSIGLARRLHIRTDSESSVQDQVQSAIGEYIGSMKDDEASLNGLAAMGSGATFGIQRRQVENGRRTYMASVSPCFFTHYGANSFNKNVMSFFSVV